MPAPAEPEANTGCGTEFNGAVVPDKGERTATRSAAGTSPPVPSTSWNSRPSFIMLY